MNAVPYPPVATSPQQFTTLRTAAALAVIFLPLAVGWAHTLRVLELRWRVDPSASHGYLVAPLALWLARRAWRQPAPADLAGRPLRRRTTAAATAMITAGFVVHLVSTVFSIQAGNIAGLVCALQGSILMLCGPGCLRQMSGPLLLLLFMAPLPMAIQQPLTLHLQELVATTSTFTLRMCGLPIYQEGCYLHLPGSLLEVAEGCSGLRQLTVFTAMSAVLWIHHRHTSARGTVLLLLSIPVAIGANTIRIVATGLVILFLGPRWAAGVFHSLEGLATALLGLAVLLALSRRLTRHSTPLSAEATALSADNNPPATNTDTTRSSLPRLETSSTTESSRCAPGRQWIVAALILGGTTSSVWFETRLRASVWQVETPLNASLASFPLRFGDWTGHDEPVSRDYVLYGDDHIHRRYFNTATGESLLLWMVYTNDGRDRGHHPEVCMRVAGYQEDVDRRATVTLSSPQHQARRFYYNRPDVGAELVYYWHYSLTPDQRTGLSLPERLYSASHSRSSSLTVGLFVPASTSAPGELSDSSDSFAAQIDADMQHWLPRSAQCGCESEAFIMARRGGPRLTTGRTTRTSAP